MINILFYNIETMSDIPLPPPPSNYSELKISIPSSSSYKKSTVVPYSPSIPLPPPIYPPPESPVTNPKADEKISPTKSIKVSTVMPEPPTKTYVPPPPSILPQHIPETPTRKTCMMIMKYPYPPQPEDPKKVERSLARQFAYGCMLCMCWCCCFGPTD
jgi:hypothetical protein